MSPFYIFKFSLLLDSIHSHLNMSTSLYNFFTFFYDLSTSSNPVMPFLLYIIAKLHQLSLLLTSTISTFTSLPTTKWLPSPLTTQSQCDPSLLNPFHVFYSSFPLKIISFGIHSLFLKALFPPDTTLDSPFFSLPPLLFCINLTVTHILFHFLKCLCSSELSHNTVYFPSCLNNLFHTCNSNVHCNYL